MITPIITCQNKYKNTNLGLVVRLKVLHCICRVLYMTDSLSCQSVVNGKILKCTTSWKWVIVESTEENSGLTVLWTVYVGYFSWPILWVHCGVIRCTSQGFRCDDFQKATKFPQFSSNFTQTLWKIWSSGNTGYYFLAICQIYKILWHFEISSTTWFCVNKNFEVP